MSHHTTPDLMSAERIREFAIANGFATPTKLAEASGVPVSTAHGILTKPEKDFAQSTLRRLTEWVEGHPVREQDEAEAGAAGCVTPQTDDQTFEAADQLVSRNDTAARPGPERHRPAGTAAARHRPAPSPQGAASPAAAATSPHPGDDGLVIDPADGDAPTPDSNDDTEVAI